MSLKNEETKILEEEVVEVESTESVDLEKEAKKAKVVEVAKKVGKIAAIAAVGVVGFLLGSAVGSKSENNDSDIVTVEDDIEVLDEK